MKTIFDRAIRDQLIDRIQQIQGNEVADWGKMNLYQMLRHNTYWNGWILGTDKHGYKQEFMGKIFGKIALNRMIRDEKPFDKNVPTSKAFKVQETQGDLESERTLWINMLKEYETYDNPDFVHDFFGKMTREEIGILVYKHTDHHLRQFGH